ncbi:MAG: hypothetical protein RBR69_01240 [Candidatus Cloacimonadaceae bacterium]|jgi:hypothetical protein|nr:hypothetical protein [Candidatus Cloacimonadota bacterium]MCK9241911.1 hypothetical protein [Candidatus Cloacimonadota bacterium]MDY0126749.1 hypothetical protein [Candidatus Cloacimonadaceae bacterium]
MSVLLDVIGSVLIGGMLLVMIFTFTTQLSETTQRAIYTSTMIDYMDQAGTKINALVALAGIGIDEDEVVVTADSTRLVFKTMWSYDNDVLTNAEHTIDLSVETGMSDLGNVITIKQDGALLSNPAYVSYIDTYIDSLKVKYYGYILYVESMKFEYFDEDDNLTDEEEDIRSAGIELTFKRDAVGLVSRPLRTSLYIRCFFMNSYMRMGV